MKRVTFEEVMNEIKHTFDYPIKIKLYHLEYSKEILKQCINIKKNDSVGSLRDKEISIYDILYGIWYIKGEEKHEKGNKIDKLDI